MSESLITKRAIVQALKELCRTKPFHKISVADITGHCGLNRQTFYYHFQDKFELLNWIYYSEAFSKVVEDISLDNWNGHILLLLNTMLEDRNFYTGTIRDQEEHFSDYLQKITQTLFFDAINKLDSCGKLPREQKDFYAEFFSYGICGMVVSWAKKGMKESPESVALLLRSLVDNSEKVAYDQYTAN